jgi:hypothetical protein
MQKRGFSSTPVIYIFIIIGFITVILFGLNILSKAQKSATQVELTSFIFSLNKAINEQSYHSYDSTNTVTLSLPVDVTQLCFIDKRMKMDEFANIELSSNVEIYSDKNLFFSPSEKYAPGFISNFELEENPLCVKSSQGKIKLTFTSRGNASMITASQQDVQQKECISLLYNGNPDNKIDVVFLGQQYGLLEFIPSADDYIQNIFLATEPFKSYANSFNFYRIDDLQDLNCKTKDYIFCNEYKVKQLASNCPHDYIVVLMKRSKIIDLASPLRSSAYSNIININTADDKLVIMHEFGHIFANLADEYVDDSYYADLKQEEYPNCDEQRCTKWQEIMGTGCFKGCSLSIYYRATENSIMKNFLSSNEYGILNNKVLSKSLQVYG